MYIYIYIYVYIYIRPSPSKTYPPQLKSSNRNDQEDITKHQCILSFPSNSNLHSLDLPLGS